MSASICSSCRAIIAAVDETVPESCTFCGTPLRSTRERALRLMLLGSAVTLGVALLGPPWAARILGPEARHLETLPVGVADPLVVVLQVLSWALLLAAGWQLFRRRSGTPVRGPLALAAISWLGAMVLSLPPGTTPYQFVLAPPELSGIAAFVLVISAQAWFGVLLMAELTAGELVVSRSR